MLLVRSTWASVATAQTSSRNLCITPITVGGSGEALLGSLPHRRKTRHRETLPSAPTMRYTCLNTARPGSSPPRSLSRPPPSGAASSPPSIPAEEYVPTSSPFLSPATSMMTAIATGP